MLNYRKFISYSVSGHYVNITLAFTDQESANKVLTNKELLLKALEISYVSLDDVECEYKFDLDANDRITEVNLIINGLPRILISDEHINHTVLISKRSSLELKEL